MAQNANINVNATNPSQLIGYRTYSIEKLHATDSMIEPRLLTAISRNLQLKGWHEVGVGGDVEVTAVLANYNDSELYEQFYGELNDVSWNSAGIDPAEQEPVSVAQAPGGTLILDLYDSHTGELIWRGTATDFLTSNTDKNGLLVETAVNRMLGTLPWDDSPVSYSPWINPS